MNGTLTRTLQADVVIAGSGPGGATVARELSRKGKKVIVCEAGKYHKWFGYTLSTVNMLDRKGMTFSREGNWIVSGRTAGGGSVVYGGVAFKPPEWLQEKYAIDLFCNRQVLSGFCLILPGFAMFRFNPARTGSVSVMFMFIVVRSGQVFNKAVYDWVADEL